MMNKSCLKRLKQSKRLKPILFRLRTAWQLTWFSFMLWLLNRIISVITSPIYLVENLLYIILHLLCIPKLFYSYKERKNKERREQWPIYVKKRICIFWTADTYDTIGLIGSVSTLAILVLVFYLQLVSYSDQRSYFNRVYQMIQRHTNYYVDYSDLTATLFLGFRCILLILERVYNAFQYTRLCVNWTYYFHDLEKKSFCRILFCFGRRVDYEKVLKKWKNEYLNTRTSTKRRRIKGNLDSRNGTDNEDAFCMDFFYIHEFERQIRTQKTFDVLLLRTFQIHEVWREFRMNGYWKTSRKMGLNMHKTLLCIVSAITFAWIVNWWEESQSVVHPLTKSACEDFGFSCIGSSQGIEEDDPCICVQTIGRSPINLVTAVLVGIVGMYATYGQLLKTVFRNWLRLNVVKTVWEATNFHEEESDVDEPPSSGESLEEIVIDFSKGQHGIQLSEIKSHSITEFEDSTAQVEDGSTTCGFAMDKKAILDDVFLLAVKKGSKDEEDFKTLVNSVKKMTKKVREGKEHYNQVKNAIMKNERKTEERNPSLISEARPIIMVDLTRRMRNIIMQGTTIFTLAPSKNNLLMLVAKGSWSGGAFLPTKKNYHKGISHTATQHYELSFSQATNEVMIKRGKRYSIYNRKFKVYNTNNSKLGFACNGRLTSEARKERT